MYLERSYGSVIPKLAFRLDEPRLLNNWIINLPVQAMNVLWKLDANKGQDWVEQAYNSVARNNYALATRLQSGVMSPGVVSQADLTLCSNNWRAWMSSSQDPELFGSVKLQKFADLAGKSAALLMAKDVYCMACDHAEPAFVFLGCQAGLEEFHPSYKHIEKIFKKPWYEEILDIPTCIKCDERQYQTPNMQVFSRYKPHLCECQPCRRGL